MTYAPLIPEETLILPLFLRPSVNKMISFLLKTLIGFRIAILYDYKIFVCYKL